MPFHSAKKRFLPRTVLTLLDASEEVSRRLMNEFYACLDHFKVQVADGQCMLWPGDFVTDHG
jgi:hypothetical protein